MDGTVRNVGDAMGACLEQPDFRGSGSAADHQPCAVPVSVWRRFRQRCEVGFRFASQLLDSVAGGSSQSRDTKMWAARARRTVCTIRDRKRSREIHIGQLSGRLPAGARSASQPPRMGSARRAVHNCSRSRSRNSGSFVGHRRIFPVDARSARWAEIIFHNGSHSCSRNSGSASTGISPTKTMGSGSERTLE